MATGIALLVSLAQINVPAETMCEIFGCFDRETELYWQRTQLQVEKQHALVQVEYRFEEQLREFEPQLQAALARRLSGSAHQYAANRPA